MSSSVADGSRHRASKPHHPTTSSSSSSTATAILATTAPEWMLILTLIFGGCCSNAYTLELATRQLPSAGTLITFAQFLVTTLSALPHFVRFDRSRPPFVALKPRAVPLYRWMVQVAFYLSTSLLNNLAFAYDVPMPVHIVFRSGGLVINMVLGWAVQKRRYTGLQVASVVLVTAGVVSSTLYSSGIAGQAAEQDGSDAGEYLTGVLLLFSALVLTGLMGLWQEQTFARYGNQNWRESMFYSHLLSLPIFAFKRRSLVRDIRHANSTTPWWFGFGPPTHPPSHTSTPTMWLDRLLALVSPSTSASRAKRDATQQRIFDLTLMPPLTHLTAFLPSNRGIWIPSFYPPLVLNVATQLLCINGVNRLTSKVSSLSVTLVLVVRKAVSLMVSVMLVEGSMGTVGLWCGAAAVLAGTIGYSVAKPAKPESRTQREKNKTQ